MQFKRLAFFAAAFTATHVQALGPSDVVMSIDTITKLSNETNDIVSSIGSGGSILSIAPKIVTNFKDIVQNALKDITMLGNAGDQDFPDNGQQDICDAFSDFVKIHQNLLRTLIGKSGLLSKTPFTAPIAAVLRILEGGVDKLAFSIIGLVPTCADSAKKDLKALDDTLDKTVQAYTIKLPGAGAITGALGGITGGLTGGGSSSGGSSMGGSSSGGSSGGGLGGGLLSGLLDGILGGLLGSGGGKCDCAGMGMAAGGSGSGAGGALGGLTGALPVGGL